MNKQTGKLLNILLNAPGQYFRYEELAERFQVSSRSIRNYVQHILTFLSDQGIPPVLTLSERGIAFTGTEAESRLLLQAAVDNDFYLYRLSPGERSYIILLNLLISDEYSTLQDLSEKLNVSRTSILKDMEQVKALLKRFRISLDPLMNRGYRLCLPEQQRRDLIIRIVQSAMGAAFSLNREVNIYERFLCEEWNLEDSFPALRRILLEAEQQNGLNVSDACFDELLLTLSVMTVRMERGALIPENPQNEETFRNLPVYGISDRILEQMREHFELSINEAEIQYLASRLYYCRFYGRAPMENAQDERLHLALTGFLMEVGRELSLPLSEDNAIFNQLESHLRDINKAHAEGILLENDYTGQMISEYPDYYNIICRYLSILEGCTGYTYTKDDIAVILIYVVVAMERYSKKDLLPRIIVVCHTGISTANFLAEKLKDNFNIHIMAVTSNHKLSELLLSCSCDLIISTVSLKEPSCRWVRVSPMLEDEDILTLQKLFMDIKREKKRKALLSKNEKECSVPLSPPVLKEENILLDISCNDWKDVICRSAGPLLVTGSIDSRYVDAMIQSFETNGAYFVYCPGVALAHAAPEDGVHFFGLSLIRLKKPVSFGHPRHDPVSWCICLAIQEKDERLQKVLHLMDLLGNESIRREMDQIMDKHSLLAYISNKEREGSYEQ